MSSCGDPLRDETTDETAKLNANRSKVRNLACIRMYSKFIIQKVCTDKIYRHDSCMHTFGLWEASDNSPASFTNVVATCKLLQLFVWLVGSGDSLSPCSRLESTKFPQSWSSRRVAMVVHVP